MVASDRFAAFLCEQLAPLGPVTLRRMFGKTGVYCGGLLLGVVSDDTRYFRVDADNRAALQEAESSPPLGSEEQRNRIVRDGERSAPAPAVSLLSRCP